MPGLLLAVRLVTEMRFHCVRLIRAIRARGLPGHILIQGNIRSRLSI